MKSMRIITTLFCFYTVLFAHADLPENAVKGQYRSYEFLEKMKKDCNALVGDEAKMKAFRSRYGFLAEKRDSLDRETVRRLEASLHDTGSMLERMSAIYGDAVGPKEHRLLEETVAPLKERSEKLLPTVFYLFTIGQSEGSIRRYMQESTKLKELFPQEVQAYGVLRGFPQNVNLKGFFEKFYEKKSDGFVLKIHPHIFRAAGIERAPAYLFSECPEDFRFKSCNNLYLVRGDISLAQALQIVSERDPGYKKYYLSLIEGFRDGEE